MLNTKDGYSWTPETGTKNGDLPCRGVVEPATNVESLEGRVYDAVVIGAGYAGLCAARDLVVSVLLVEARDRVGGRTYTVEADGFKYEMGGTWVTHHMGYLFQEMVRYKMDRDLITTHLRTYKADYYSMNVPGTKPRKMTHEEAGRIMSRAWDVFVDIDGNHCRTVCPLPHAQLDNIMVNRQDIEAWDAYSCKQRFEDIKHLLTAEEQGILTALLLHISGGTMENSSLWDMVRSHALMGWSSENFGPVWTTHKLREGQSELAMRLFRHAKDLDLHYVFQTPIVSIEDRCSHGNGLVEVRTGDNRTLLARHCVSTVPLNVLHTIKFEPPLSPRRAEAIEIGHVNFMTKIHAEVEGDALASWNGMRYPGNIMFGYGDGVLDTGNAHLVGFGKGEGEAFIPEKHPEKVVQAFKDLHPMEVKKTIFHNWVTDPYSLGGPAWWRPNYMSKFQDELQRPHGRIQFASADWAHGWRAAIDGALEQGTLAAREIRQQLRDGQRVDMPVRARMA
ncbi:monoamine oxidase N [Aureobasidium sp. EXF-10727]|nr:monoamine oxidase N [Aureobasidium sp. EXF-10727]